ncbi:hypothetical protein [Pseudoalteromonas sp. ASV78]|uniref:hypothetical protein n=1 Tax=Pseudoalteromonas sp. ASV78 TaxID=3397851 RepID=UPI0039FD7501
MSSSQVGSITLSQIIERKLLFLLKNDVFPFDGDNYDLGERDALQQMLLDSNSMPEQAFEEKYLFEVNRLSKRTEGRDYSVEKNDDYYESFSNTVVDILTLINPINMYDLKEE